MERVPQPFVHDALQLFYLSYRYGQGRPSLSRRFLAIGASHYSESIQQIPEPERISALRAIGMIAMNMRMPGDHKPMRDTEVRTEFRSEWRQFERYLLSGAAGEDIYGHYEHMPELMIETDLTWIKIGRRLDPDPYASYYRRYVLAKESTNCAVLDGIFRYVESMPAPRQKLEELVVVWQDKHPQHKFFNYLYQ